MTDHVTPGATAGSPRGVALAARGVTKRFPGVVANADVDFELREGEVHTLLGENGAGKSTLAAMLCGLYQPDEGQILRSGRPIRLRSPREGLAHGIGMVHQHFRLIPRFTVAENVILGDPTQAFLMRHGEAEDQVAAIGERFGLPIDPRAVVSDLTVGQRQRVEIVKVLYRGADVLLLDEPTAVLTPQEAETLFTTVRSMTAEGKAVVFISHKLGEVMSVSDRVTVMRGGRVTGEVATKDTSARNLAELMVGRPVESTIRRGTGVTVDEPVLQATAVRLVDGGRVALDGIDLQVRAGEIVGIAAVEGAGQHELLRLLAGRLEPASGRVQRPSRLGFVPEDRHRDGLLLDAPLDENIALRDAGARRGRMPWSALRAATTALLAERDVRASGATALARTLSGGNQQKLVLGRELADAPDAVIVENPSRGLDFQATAAVQDALRSARDAGAAVVLYSSDLDEVLMLADRVYAMFDGRLIDVVNDRDAVGRAMLGAA